MAATGGALSSVSVMLAVSEQPLALVATTVYVPAEVATTVGEAGRPLPQV